MYDLQSPDLNRTEADVSPYWFILICEIREICGLSFRVCKNPKPGQKDNGTERYLAVCHAERQTQIGISFFCPFLFFCPVFSLILSSPRLSESWMTLE